MLNSWGVFESQGFYRYDFFPAELHYGMVQKKDIESLVIGVSGISGNFPRCVTKIAI